MEMILETIPSLPIAYIRRVGAYGVGNIQTMEQIKQWAATKHLMNDETVIYGIAQDDPQQTAPNSCRYDACVRLADREHPTDENVRYGEIAGGCYGIFLVEHTAEAVGKAWSEIFLTLSEKHCSFDTTRPILERYAAEKVAQHLCEICVPIKAQ